ncbi:unnamed protein product [Prorocentrum cordatum]|uniref:Uncharacterized protein n=1 Tax=Prorocentrum cordatum TaxID=2364126 RepID=A0ABN9VPL0_9DINO|nr:unnamed protein product [Polarella glacialis]
MGYRTSRCARRQKGWGRRTRRRRKEEEGGGGGGGAGDFQPDGIEAASTRAQEGSGSGRERRPARGAVEASRTGEAYAGRPREQPRQVSKSLGKVSRRRSGRGEEGEEGHAPVANCGSSSRNTPCRHVASVMHPKILQHGPLIPGLWITVDVDVVELIERRRGLVDGLIAGQLDKRLKRGTTRFMHVRQDNHSQGIIDLCVHNKIVRNPELREILLPQFIISERINILGDLAFVQIFRNDTHHCEDQIDDVRHATLDAVSRERLAKPAEGVML